MIQPTQDWMVLKHAENPKEASLIIPETAKPVFAKTMAHVVVAIGPWSEFPAEGSDWSHDVSKGDTVVIEGLDARSFEYQGEVYFMARARDVIAIVDRREEESESWKN